MDIYSVGDSYRGTVPAPLGGHEMPFVLVRGDGRDQPGMPTPDPTRQGLRLRTDG